LTETSFYDAAEWYDFLHLPETQEELPAVLEIFRALGNGGKRVLEPACGTGRYLEALGHDGFDCFGYDLNARALAFARKRGCVVSRGDLASFKPKNKFDLAFCLVGSFRHLSTEKKALSHLRNTATALAPGGLYVVGLDLCDYAQIEDDEEVWEQAAGAKKAWHVMTTFAPDRKKRKEKILNFVAWRDGNKEGRIESAYELLSYDWPQWESLLKKSPFTLEAWFDQGGAEQRLRRPSYWLFALKRR
jgi:SAM-dependent methyltransferase